MTNHFEDISYYRNLDPLILYGDTWLYGAKLPSANIGIPKDLYVLHERNYNIISWKNSSLTDMKGYYVYRSTTIGHNDATLIAMVLNKDENENTQTCYIDYLTDNELTTQYYYAVAALNNANFFSFLSNWTADMLIDNSYTQVKYLYTDQLTQTYWSIIDLYKQLGNIDTDRNIVPYRDRGYVYSQQMVPGDLPSMYLTSEVSIESGNLNPNKNIQPGYVYTEYTQVPLVPKNIPSKVNCNYLYVTTLDDITPKKYTLYMDGKAIASNLSSKSITADIYENDSFDNLKNLSINKFVFSDKVSGSGVYDFYWNSIYDYWQYDSEEVNLEDFGITFEGTPQEHNIISVDFSSVGYVYFRVPYIYNSKVLQTYILEEGSEEKINEITFKTYNHLIFASTFGKIFNKIQIDLRESKGNLYVEDVSDNFVYKNFASYFDFRQPAWMGNINYRNCVLGNQDNGTAGLWQAAMNGGTQLGIRQVVNALSEGTATFESLSDAEYLTAYNTYFNIEGTGLNLPEIKLYDNSVSYDIGDIILYNNNFYEVLQAGTITADMFSSLNDVSILKSVNDQYRDILFKKSYTEEEPLTIISLTEKSIETYDKYELLNINDHYYEVRNQINAYYDLVTVTDTEPVAYGLSDGAMYFNTMNSNLYILVNGSWEIDTTDLITDAIYLDKLTGKLYQYNETTLVDQTSLRKIDYICNALKFGAIPLDINAIYQLVGNEYYLISLEEPVIEKDYIFKNYDEYITDEVTDPISYTYQYILNTYQVTFNSWTKPANGEKYLVYGNKIKLNNQNVIYPDPSFKVYADKNLTQEISNILYTVDVRTGTLIWNYEDNRPVDGSYIWLYYNIDIRPEIKKRIELVKFPQVNIKYVWL